MADADSDDPARRRAAASDALGLLRDGYRDPDFRGAAEYVVGLDAFHRAAEAAAAGEDAAPLWRAADRYLTESKRQGVDPPHRTRVRYALGVTLAERGRFRDALAPLRSVLDDGAGPDGGAAFPELLPVLAEAALSTGRPLDREDALLRLAAAPPGMDDELAGRVALARGRLLVAGGRHGEAVAAVATLPADDPAAVRLRAAAALADGRPRDAAALLAALPERRTIADGSDESAPLLRARVAEAAGDADAALVLYRRAAGGGGMVPTLAVGRLLAARGRLEEAVAAIGGVLETHAASGRDATPELAAATLAALEALGDADPVRCAELCTAAAPAVGETAAARLRLATLAGRLDEEAMAALPAAARNRRRPGRGPGGGGLRRDAGRPGGAAVIPAVGGGPLPRRRGTRRGAAGTGRRAGRTARPGDARRPAAAGRTAARCRRGRTRPGPTRTRSSPTSRRTPRPPPRRCCGAAAGWSGTMSRGPKPRGGRCWGTPG